MQCVHIFRCTYTLIVNLKDAAQGRFGIYFTDEDTMTATKVDIYATQGVI